jgi:hypothetical protein
MIIGVDNYIFGDGPGASLVAGGLPQLTSPRKSAFAIADWFLNEFQNADASLGTLTMLVSQKGQAVYPFRGKKHQLSPAKLKPVKTAMAQWRDVFESHPENMAVFYFCGHGVSFGQKAAMLLSDFGDPSSAYEGAIDLDNLRGTMRNAQPSKQLFIVDCCRTKADSLYDNEAAIGGRVLSVVPAGHTLGSMVKQCVMLPTIDGEQAFGVANDVSVFTSAFLDAVRFAGFNDSTGNWVSTTLLILDAISRLVEHRLPQRLRERTVPTALESASFEFNYIKEPQTAKSIVTIEEPAGWPDGTFSATDVTGAGRPTQHLPTSAKDSFRYCQFELEFGTWEFSGDPDVKPPTIKPARRTCFRPVAYVKLEVTP